MSGIYIPGMEMPTSCFECPLKKIWDDGVQCLVNKGLWMDCDSKHKACPLVPVPDHGDLIDRDALPENRMVFNGVRFIKERFIEEAPVVIPSDKEGKG